MLHWETNCFLPLYLQMALLAFQGGALRGGYGRTFGTVNG